MHRVRSLDDGCLSACSPLASVSLIWASFPPAKNRAALCCTRERVVKVLKSADICIRPLSPHCLILLARAAEEYGFERKMKRSIGKTGSGQSASDFKRMYLSSLFKNTRYFKNQCILQTTRPLFLSSNMAHWNINKLASVVLPLFHQLANSYEFIPVEKQHMLVCFEAR